MKLRSLLIIVIAAAACYYTKPERKDHVAKLAEDLVNATMDLDDKKASETAKQLFSEMEQATEDLINSKLNVKDYGLLTIGTLNDAGQDEKVSVGIMGHVFTYTNKASDKFKEQFNNLLNQTGKY